MKGFFISEENANELGLLDLKSFSEKSQKTIIIVTENDINDFTAKAQFSNIDLDNEKIKGMSLWFYKNYYDSLLESLIEQ